MLRNTTAVIITGLFLTIASTARANVVQFDISSAINYDGVGTSLEMSAKTTAYISGTLGDHGFYTNRHYTNQGSVSSGTALPDDGVIGPYQIATAFDNGTDGLTKSDNLINIATNNSDPNPFSATITLPVSQQNPYLNFNMLFVTRRDADHGNYRSWIVAQYTDSTSEIVVDTGLSSTGVHGTFGGTLESATWTNTFPNQAPGDFGTIIGVQPVLVMDRIAGQSGTSQDLRSGTAVLWEFDTPILLDPNKTLESLTINLNRSGVNRNHGIWIMAANGELVPEPASLALVGLGGLLLLGRRR